MKDLAFVGRKYLGGVKMRGVEVAQKMGVPFIDNKKLDPWGKKFDTIILVKYWINDQKWLQTLRNRCHTLIYDPLDSWTQTRPHYKATAFWKWTQKILKWDRIVATSGSCVASMIECNKPIHMGLHHADSRIKNDWYDPKGPIVYAGGLRFIASELDNIKPICKKLNRILIVAGGKDCWQSLQGASLVLHPRFSPEDTDLNKHCKPQVKLENSIAAGIPIVATWHPCVFTCRHNVQNMDPKNDFGIAEALECGPYLENPFTIDHYIEEIRKWK